MKIEKINENKIRCFLTRDDLENRHIKLSEIAYGTEKARSLFRDMMEQASSQFGFEADNIPLMVEAIPMSALFWTLPKSLTRKNWIPVFPDSPLLPRIFWMIPRKT